METFSFSLTASRQDHMVGFGVIKVQTLPKNTQPESLLLFDTFCRE
jgi:hypothetical protein